MFNDDDEGRFDYLAGREISRAACAVGDDAQLRLVASRYAVVRHHGHIGSIPLTWRAFLGEWLPASGLIAADAPEFERYDAHFDPMTGAGGVEL